MYAFDYSRPTSRNEAAALLASDSEARLLAGGMSLLPAMKLHLARPSMLIDLSGIADLKGIAIEQGIVRVGAMTSHAEVARSQAVIRALPALAHLAGGIGDRQVRNRGTMGGSVANCDPAACYPAAVLGLGAVVRTSRRSIPSDAFFIGLFETALEPGEFIVAIDFPIPLAAAYEKFRQPASRFALVGVFVARFAGGVTRVAVTGAGASVFRASALESALARDFSATAAAAVEIGADGLNSDLHGDAAYRAALIPILAARAVARIS